MITPPPPEDSAAGQRRRAPASGADVAATVALLLGHTGLLLFSLLVATVMSMGEPCPPPGCYGEQRTTVAIVLCSAVAGLVFLADLTVAVVLIALRRPAAPVPALGCLIQTMIIAVALLIAS